MPTFNLYNTASPVYARGATKDQRFHVLEFDLNFATLRDKDGNRITMTAGDILILGSLPKGTMLGNFISPGLIEIITPQGAVSTFSLGDSTLSTSLVASFDANQAAGLYDANAAGLTFGLVGGAAQAAFAGSRMYAANSLLRLTCLTGNLSAARLNIRIPVVNLPAFSS